MTELPLTFVPQRVGASAAAAAAGLPATLTVRTEMAQRRTAVSAAAEPDFLQFNDLACEAVGGRVSHCVVVMTTLA